MTMNDSRGGKFDIYIRQFIWKIYKRALIILLIIDSKIRKLIWGRCRLIIFYLLRTL